MAKNAQATLSYVNRAKELGCKFALYNHGGWGGEPRNLVAVCEFLRQRHGGAHVGIVYNFHHGHEHIDEFATVLKLMLPYLLCVNLNGMNDAEAVKANAKRNKILPIGDGQHERQMIAVIRDSKYSGPIGILDHRSEIDAQQSLRQNLAGLGKVLRNLTTTDGEER